MTLVDLALHGLDFLAPALGLGLLAGALARLALGRVYGGVGWLRLLVTPVAASAVALIAGLLWFGRDGRIETYAAMLLATALGLGWVARRGPAA